MQRPEVKQKVSDGTKKRFKEHPESHGMKNKKHKPESIQQMSESHSNMSQETKDKIGQASHIMWENPEIRAKLLVHIQNPLEETRKKMRDKKLGKSSWNKNIPCREETKKKIGLANTGKICKEETKKKLRESCGKKLAKDYIFLDPNENKIEIHNLSKYCRENNLNQGLMSAVSLGKRKQHKGYKQYIPI
jgi:hypothetical protein